MLAEATIRSPMELNPEAKDVAAARRAAGAGLQPVEASVDAGGESAAAEEESVAVARWGAGEEVAAGQ